MKSHPKHHCHETSNAFKTFELFVARLLKHLKASNVRGESSKAFKTSETFVTRLLMDLKP